MKHRSQKSRPTVAGALMAGAVMTGVIAPVGHAAGQPPYNPYPSEADIKYMAATQQKTTPPPFNPYPTNLGDGNSEAEDDVNILAADDYYTPREDDSAINRDTGSTGTSTGSTGSEGGVSGSVVASGPFTGSVQYMDTPSTAPGTTQGKKQPPRKKEDGMLTPEQIARLDKILYNPQLTNSTKVTRSRAVASEPVRPVGYFVRTDAENARIQQQRQQQYQSPELQQYNQGYQSPELQQYNQYPQQYNPSPQQYGPYQQSPYQNPYQSPYGSPQGSYSFQDYSSYGQQNTMSDSDRAALAQQLRRDMGYATTAGQDDPYGLGDSSYAGGNLGLGNTSTNTPASPGSVYTTRRTDIPYITRYEVFSICDNKRLTDGEKVARLKVLVNRPKGTGTTGIKEKNPQTQITFIDRFLNFITFGLYSRQFPNTFGTPIPKKQDDNSLSARLKNIITGTPIKKGDQFDESGDPSIMNYLRPGGKSLLDGINTDESSILDQLAGQGAKTGANITHAIYNIFAPKKPSTDFNTVMGTILTIRANHAMAGLTPDTGSDSLLGSTFIYDTGSGLSTYIDKDTRDLILSPAGDSFINVLRFGQLINSHEFESALENTRINLIASEFDMNLPAHLSRGDRIDAVINELITNIFHFDNPDTLSGVSQLIDQFTL